MRLFRGLAATSLVLLTTLMFAGPAFAQQSNVDNEDEGIGVGALAMITRASLSVEDDLFDISSRTGTGFGLWIGGNKNGRVGFTGEFIYLIRKSVEDAGELDETEFKTTALEIPAVFHINVGSNSRNSVSGYGLFGPVFTFTLSQQIDGEDVDDDQKFKGADIGIMAGAGVEFFRIGVEVRGNWGLRNISPEGDVINVKGRSIEFVGKFRFN